MDEYQWTAPGKTAKAGGRTTAATGAFDAAKEFGGAMEGKRPQCDAGPNGPASGRTSAAISPFEPLP